MRRFIPIIFPLFIAAPAYGYLLVQAARIQPELIAAPYEPMLPEEKAILRESQARAVKNAYQLCKWEGDATRIMNCMKRKYKRG